MHKNAGITLSSSTLSLSIRTGSVSRSESRTTFAFACKCVCVCMWSMAQVQFAELTKHRASTGAHPPFRATPSCSPWEPRRDASDTSRALDTLCAAPNPLPHCPPACPIFLMPLTLHQASTRWQVGVVQTFAGSTKVDLG